MPILEVKGLQKSYSGRRVVDDVNLHVSRGEIVGLLGPNGAGKTTTFRMVMGMVAPDTGMVRLEGEDISHLPMYQRARRGLGYLAQEPSIFRHLTVEENVMAILETQRYERHKRRDRLNEILSDLGLRPLAQNMAYTLSGGERRRLEICRALVRQPHVLLLDEPFSGVDPKACEEIQKIILSLAEQRDIGILLTDHNVFETFTIVDRAYIIREGRVLRHGTPLELVNDADARRLYLGDKFTEYGEAFTRLREEIAAKNKQHATPRIGRTTRIIRLEEEELRRQQAARERKMPLIKAVAPDRGTTLGGTSVAIIGSNFGPEPVTVLFGDKPAAEINVSADTRITCRTPPAAAPGPVDVIVRVGDKIAGLAKGYTYTE